MICIEKALIFSVEDYKQFGRAWMKLCVVYDFCLIIKALYGIRVSLGMGEGARNVDI